MAAQKQAISRNAIKTKIDKIQNQSKCILCILCKNDETVRYIVCEYPMVTQREYKRRYGWVGRKIHWEICRKIGCDVNGK